MKLLTALLFSLFVTFSTEAQEIKLGDLIIMNPIARATPPGAKIGGGYILIKNNGTISDRLIGGTASFAEKVEIHEMKMVDTIMKMKKLEDGLEIPAGATVKLQPGGYHIMFMRLKEGLKVNGTRKVTLTFEKAGKIELLFQVKSITETMKLGKKMELMGTDG